MEKTKYIEDKIELLEFQKILLRHKASNCISYDPIIAINKLDKDIEKWKDLTDEEYKKIESEIKTQEDKYESEEKATKKFIEDLGLTEDQYYKMSDEEFDKHINLLYKL